MKVINNVSLAVENSGKSSNGDEPRAGVPVRGFRGIDVIGECVRGPRGKLHHLQLVDIGNIGGVFHLKMR